MEMVLNFSGTAVSNVPVLEIVLATDSILLFILSIPELTKSPLRFKSLVVETVPQY
jgi:hypothetical protein